MHNAFAGKDLVFQV